MTEKAMGKFLKSDLVKRYGMSRTTTYDRLNALYIKPFKEGKLYYITDEQLRLMDELDTHLKNRGKIAKFVAARIESGEIYLETLPDKTEAIVLPQEQAVSGVFATSEEHQEAVVFEEEKVVSTALPEDAIAHPEAQREIKISNEELEKAEERERYLAQAKVIIPEEAFTRFYKATEGFTNLELKEHLERHRQNGRQRQNQVTANTLNDFLSQKLQAVGMSG